MYFYKIMTLFILYYSYISWLKAAFHIISFLHHLVTLFGFPERLFPHAKYDSHRMRMLALVISWISIIYNGIEGGVSIGLGADVVSRALIVFGIQSLVEVLSAGFVIYRFRRELVDSSPSNLSLERRATLGIGILFILLTIGTWAASIIALVTHAEPDSSKPSLIVSATALVFMIFIWLPKPWIATELNSSVMRGEAACSLACIYLTIVLFAGSLVYKLWHGGWWIDSAVAILLGFFFLYEGWEMVAWARHKDFNGGCCKTCSVPPNVHSVSNNPTIVDNCNEVCSQICSAHPVAVSFVDSATTVNKCNEGCSRTCSVSPNVASTSNDTPIVVSCNEGCSKTCSTPFVTASFSNDSITSAIECGSVKKCDCCASKKECIESGTCVCRPLLVDNTSSADLCCSGPTKCCSYGKTAVCRL